MAKVGLHLQESLETTYWIIQDPDVIAALNSLFV